ncbi:MAG: DUF1428 domain-containing protein [Nibricoccus sp.]
MAHYVDGFVLPIRKTKIAQYQKMAKTASKVWLKHGALDYRECVLEDRKDPGFCLTFPKGIKSKPGETVVFAFITYKSRKDRDRINAKVMKDPELCPPDMDPKKMPFDCARMLYGGFKTLVGA